MWLRVIFCKYFFVLFVLFVFSSLIYDYYQYNSNLYHQLFNANNSIEHTLKHISTCNSNDRRRQRILLTLLQAWTQLAEKYNIQYWISYGSLIGYVQRRGLLPHDEDIDITIMSDDTSQLVNISQLIFASSNYEIKIQPQWKFVGYEKRSYFHREGIHFVAPNARFINRKTGNHIDIFPAHHFNPLNSTEDKQSENLTEYNLYYNWVSYPRTWTYPLKICYFSEIKVLCPAKPEKLVEFMYGVSALTKSDTKCINGKWVNND